jgi:hypothetical protein
MGQVNQVLGMGGHISQVAWQSSQMGQVNQVEEIKPARSVKI